MSEIRYDRLHDTHVIIAPERLSRPNAMKRNAPERASKELCPFCEGNECMTPPEIMALRAPETAADAPGWKTRIVPNLYGAVKMNAGPQTHDASFECLDGFGSHEVLVDTPRHLTVFADLDEKHMLNWLQTVGKRVRQLRQDGRFAYIAIFKNEGPGAGATQPHTHTQIVGIPFVPASKRAAFLRAYHYFEAHGTTLHAAALKDEMASAERVLYNKNRWIAYCPFASAVPYEIMITADDFTRQVDTLDDDQLRAVAAVMKTVLSRMQTALGVFDYNLEISVPPLKDLGLQAGSSALLDRIAPFCIRILPRLFRLGGFETSTGVMINPVTPEQAARRLRGEK